MPKTLRDFQGLDIRLTDERLAHILGHPEMVGMEAAIEETLGNPVQVVESLSDPQSHEGNILGFSVLRVSALREKPLEVAL